MSASSCVDRDRNFLKKVKELHRKIQLGIKPFKYEYLDALITIIEPEAGQEWWMVRVFTQAMCLYSQTIPDPQPRSPFTTGSVTNHEEKKDTWNQLWPLAWLQLVSADLLLLLWSQVHLPAGSQIFLWASFSLLSLYQYCNWVNACIVRWAWASCIFWSFGNVYCRVATELLAWSLGLSCQHCKVSKA